nr:integrase, catalytic region, zinc finger, CCHC-type, peptidase aspartic, catalytic [Tanacetum cinerariifolium]
MGLEYLTLVETDTLRVSNTMQSNMYNFDLQNVVPSGDLACLFAKASIDESNLWNRRLGHVNFKTMNKLVKENLVRGNQTDKNAGPQDTNGNLGTQDNVNAGKKLSDQHYIMLPLWSSISSTFKSSDDKATYDKPTDDAEKEASDAADALRQEFEQGCIDKKGVTNYGSNNSFNTVSHPVNAASTSRTFSVGGPSSPNPEAFIPANTLLHHEINFMAMQEADYCATSTTEVEYVAVANCCGQFWNTATSKTVNSVKQIHAIVDGKVVVISESSVRSNLLFNDKDASSENRPPMLNKEKYVPWSSRLLQCAKSRPNGKLIRNSIINGPYVRRMIPEQGDPNREVPTILLSLPEDIYTAVDSCETAQEIWLCDQQMMKGSDIGIQEKKAKLFNEWEMFTSTDGESIESYYHRFLKLINDFKRNKHFPKKIASNLKFLNNLQPEWSRHVTIVHQTKDLHTADYTQLYDFLKYNQKEVVQDAVQNPGVQNVGNQNGLIDVSGTANQNLNRNGNLVAVRAEANLDEIEEVNANYILMANLQQASTLGVQSDKVPVYDSNGSSEVHNYDNCCDNEIFNMFTQEEQYTKLLEPILEPHQVLQNDNNVIFEVSSVEQSRETVEQHLANVEETRVLYDSLYNNLEIEDEKVNTEISDLNKQLSMEKSTVSTLLEEKKKLKSNFKICEDELLDKQIQLENKIKELDKILVKMGQSIQTMHMLSPKPDSFYHTKQKMALGYQNPFYLKQVQHKQQSLYNGKVLLEKHDPPVVHDSKETLQLAQENPDESLAKHKALELEIEHLLRAVVSQDIMSVVKNSSVGDTSNLHTELEHTLNPLSQKLENENMELEFQVLNYAKENAHLKTKYKNLFDSISVTRTQTKTIIDSLQKKLHDTIYENAKLRAQLFDKVSEQKDTTCGMSVNTKFAKQSILGKPPSSSRAKLYAVTPIPKSIVFPKVGETHALSNPVTSNSIPPSQESKVMKNDKVIAPGMFRINLFKPSREEKRNIKNDRVPSTSKSSCSKNKEVEVEEHPKNLLLSKNKKHMSSECNNIKLSSQNDIVVCAMCKQCLISTNHDVCLLNYVNDMNSRGKKQKENVSINENQKKQKPKVKKPKKVGSIERLASPKPGFGDLQWGNILITMVYFIEGLGYNLFSVRQFCDSDLEVAFRRNACFVRNLKGVDLLTGNLTIKLYTINLHEMASASLICLMARAKAARTMLIFSRAPLFLWSEAIATACYTQNRFIIHHRFNKIPYELINGRKLDISFLHVFGVLCYPKNDREDIRKLGAKGLDLTYAPSRITTQQPNEGELDLLFKAMYDDYIGGQPSASPRTTPAAQTHPVRQTITGSTIADTAPTLKNSSSQASNFLNSSQDVDGLKSQQQHAQQQGNQALLQPESVADNV